MILKYDHKWTSSPVCPEVRDHSAKERIVVTGTTGAVGSYLLAGLLENDKVETVWAFNRKSKEGLMARQKASFEEKMLDVSLLESTKLVMLEGNLESVNFGLQEDVYHRVRIAALSSKRTYTNRCTDSNGGHCHYPCTYQPQWGRNAFTQLINLECMGSPFQLHPPRF